MERSEQQRAEPSREQRRAELVPALSRLTRSRDFRESLNSNAGERSLTVIPVLVDDTMDYVFGRLRATEDRRAVVAMETKDSWEIALLWPASCARVDVAREDDTLTAIHSDCEVSMLFEYLHSNRQTVVIEQVAARLLECSTS